MSGYTPPPAVYFWDTFVLYQAGGTGSTSRTRVTENFVADIAIVGWFPDFKLFGADPGFAVMVPFGSNRATANYTLAAPIGLAQRFSLADEITPSGYRIQRHPWLACGRATLERDPDRLRPDGKLCSQPVVADRPEPPRPRSQGGLYVPRSPDRPRGHGRAWREAQRAQHATNYQSGAELHFEWEVNKHFPLGLAAGVGGYFHQQVTNDHGSGDPFGAFKGRVAAVGPLLGYALKAGAQEVDFSARWFHEFAVQNRLRGDLIYASFSFPL
jgi:hypothetical protein